jgi:hypothetical protein
MLRAANEWLEQLILNVVQTPEDDLIVEDQVMYRRAAGPERQPKSSKIF